MSTTTKATASGARSDLASSVPSEISGLTGWRGLAAIGVVIYHVNLGVYLSNLHVRPPGILGRGYLCVDFFFVLSGFVMAHVYTGMFEQFKLQNYLKFICLRIGRIYPLYCFLLTFIICYTLVFYGNFHSGQPPAVQTHFPLMLFTVSYFLLQSWGIAIQSVVGNSWSISTELIAYLMFPVFCRIFPRLNWIGSAILTGLALCALWAATQRVQNVNLDITGGPLADLRCLAEFLIGMQTYRVYASLRCPFSRGDVFLSFVIGVILVAVATPTNDVCVVALLPLLVIGTAWNDGLIISFLESPPVRYFGLISFSIYLVQPVINPWILLWSGEPKAPTDVGQLLLAMVVSVVATIACSHLTYRYVEAPGRRLIRRLSSRYLPA